MHTDRSLFKIIYFIACSNLIFAISCGFAEEKSRTVILNHYCESTDPLYASSSQCYPLIADIHEGLVRVGPNGEPEPGVAEGWEWDGENKRLTFKLKTDRFWSDGTPVVAEDFALAWRRILVNDKNTTNPFLRILKKVKGATQCQESSELDCASGVRVIDAHTLVMEFDDIDRLFPLRTLNGALMPTPSHFYQQHGESWSERLDRPYNGAYRVDSPEDLSALGLKLNDLRLLPNRLHPDITENNVPLVIYRRRKESYTGANIRELVFDEDNADIIFAINDVPPEALNFLENHGWTSTDQNSLYMVSLIFNVNTVEQELIEALKLILHPDEVESRIQSNMGKVAYRLYNHASATEFFNNKHIREGVNERTKKAQSLLSKIDISPKKERIIKISGVAHVSVDRMKFIGQLVKQYGVVFKFLDVRDYSLQKTLARQDKIDAMYLSWFVSLPDPSGFLLIPNWTAFPILTNEQQSEFQRIQNPTGEFLSEEERMTQLHKAEEFFVNEGGLLPLVHLQQSIIFRNDLCGVTGSQSLTSPLLWIRLCDQDPKINYPAAEQRGIE